MTHYSCFTVHTYLSMRWQDLPDMPGGWAVDASHPQAGAASAPLLLLLHHAVSQCSDRADGCDASQADRMRNQVISWRIARIRS